MNGFGQPDEKDCYTLMERDGVFQWRTFGGVAMSPEFSSREEAEKYQAGRVLLPVD